MANFVSRAKQHLFEIADKVGFVDPATGLGPAREIELSAILSCYHQYGRIDWSTVPLLTSEGASSGSNASTVIERDAVVGTEYPLVAHSQAQIEVWGGMPADLLFLSRDGSAVTLVESKIGGQFTYRADPKGGQIVRQIDYLRSTKPDRKSYILLTASRRVDLLGSVTRSGV